MESDIGEERVSHLEQHEADLDVLAEIADLVSKQAGPQQLLTSVLAVLERRLGMLRGTVMLLLPDGKELFVEAAHGCPHGDGEKRSVSQREKGLSAWSSRPLSRWSFRGFPRSRDSRTESIIGRRKTAVRSASCACRSVWRAN